MSTLLFTLLSWYTLFISFFLTFFASFFLLILRNASAICGCDSSAHATGDFTCIRCYLHHLHSHLMLSAITLPLHVHASLN